MITMELEEEEKQSILLALALLSSTRPGWDHHLNGIALKIDAAEKGRAVSYDLFRQCLAASIPVPEVPLETKSGRG